MSTLKFRGSSSVACDALLPRLSTRVFFNLFIFYYNLWPLLNVSLGPPLVITTWSLVTFKFLTIVTISHSRYKNQIYFVIVNTQYSSSYKIYIRLISFTIKLISWLMGGGFVVDVPSKKLKTLCGWVVPPLDSSELSIFF